MAEVGGVYALGVGTTGIAPPPGVIQSPTSSSCCPLAILLLIVLLLRWSCFPLTVDFPLAAEVAMVPPPSFAGMLGGGGRAGWWVHPFAFALGPFSFRVVGGPGIEAKWYEID